MYPRTNGRSLLTWLAAILPCAATAPTASAATAPTNKANFVIILCDDLGYGDLGCYGCTDIRTPRIDRLAEQGVRFTNFYSNGPECSPTRTALFTGRYQQRVGGLECAIGTGNVGRYDDAIRLRSSNDLGLPVEDSILARLLKKKGYATGCFGKWHLGYESKFSTVMHGFDRAFGPLGGGVDYFHHTEWDGTPVLAQNGKPTRRDGYLTDLITEEAVAFIQQHRQSPFFLYVPYTAPHTPYQGPDDRRDTPILQPEWNKGARQTYAKMVERLDDGVGAILKALKDNHLERNTLVIFASDNGPTRIGSAGPFSGLKSSLYEGGIRVPGIIRWPGALPEGRVAEHTTITMDLTASILRIAGATPPADRPLDGIDVIRELQADRPPAKRTLFWRSRRGERTWRAVRDGSVKFLSRVDGDAIEEHLFDLARDPGEKMNIANQQPEETRRLEQLLAEWEKDVQPRR